MFRVTVAAAVGIYELLKAHSSNCAPHMQNPEVPVPAAVCPRVALAFGTAAKLTFAVVAEIVFVTTLSLYQPFGSDSIEPVQRDELHTVPVDKSKFTYHSDIPLSALHCTKLCPFDFTQILCAYTEAVVVRLCVTH